MLVVAFPCLLPASLACGFTSVVYGFSLSQEKSCETEISPPTSNMTGKGENRAAEHGNGSSIKFDGA